MIFDVGEEFDRILRLFIVFDDIRTDSQSEAELERIAAQEQKFFPFEVLVTATNHFHASNKLGQGGFGPVYKVNFRLGLSLNWSQEKFNSFFALLTAFVVHFE